MLAMAEGRTSWLTPALGGVPTDAAHLPHWIGAAFIALTSPWLDPELAVRIPFALLLTATMVALWYGSFALARTEAAQPLPFAFGGEAAGGGLRTRDRRRDHPGPDRDARVCCNSGTRRRPSWPSWLRWPRCSGRSRWRHFTWRARVWPSCWHCPHWLAAARPRWLPCWASPASWSARVRTTRACGDFAWWVAAATALACVAAWLLDQWAWRVTPPISVRQLLHVARQWLWFLWPAWLLALWALWRWRDHLTRRHLSDPADRAGQRPGGEPGHGRLRPRADCSACPAWPCWPRLRCRPCAAAPVRRSTGSRCSSSRCWHSACGSSTSRCKPACRPKWRPTWPSSRPASNRSSRGWR